MQLKVHLAVKFRAFFITFAEFTRDWTLPIQVMTPQSRIPVTGNVLDFNMKGVTLTLEVV